MRMQLRQRVVRLEKAAARRPPDNGDELRWQGEQLEAYLDAYARQEEAARRRRDCSGDDSDAPEPCEAALGGTEFMSPWPRCPSGFDPAKWESRGRICAYLETTEPPPGLTVEEKTYVDDLRATLVWI